MQIVLTRDVNAEYIRILSDPLYVICLLKVESIYHVLVLVGSNALVLSDSGSASDASLPVHGDA